MVHDPDCIQAELFVLLLQVATPHFPYADTWVKLGYNLTQLWVADSETVDASFWTAIFIPAVLLMFVLRLATLLFD
jgi:hypothetical protein